VAVVMVKRAPPKFSGVLNTPIPKYIAYPLHDIPSTTNTERQVAYHKRVAALRFEKLEALLGHYRIPKSAEDRWLILSFLLAVDFVPGMRVVDRLPRRARPREKWGQELQYCLCPEIDHIRALKPHRTIVAAIRIARTQRPETWGKYAVATLQTRYYEQRKKNPGRAHLPVVGMLAKLCPQRADPT
jgi:hypothetical protein